MITPEYLNDVVKGTRAKVAEIDAYLIGRIAKRIGDLFDYDGTVKLIPSSIKDLHKLMDQGALIKDIENELVKLMPELEEEIKQAFKDASQEIAKGTHEYTNTLITAVNKDGANIEPLIPLNIREGMPLDKMGLTSVEIRYLENAFKQTKGTIKNMTRTTALQANNIYLSECDNAYMKIKAGVSPNTAICEAIESMSKSGVSVIDYASGAKANAETALTRAVRTGVNKANGEVILTRAAELGVNYVYVSQHLGARVTNTDDYKNHSKWQGKVYELDYSEDVLRSFREDAEKGASEYAQLKAVRDVLKSKQGKYPSFVKECGYGQLLGICGVNCRHTFSMFVPGINKEPEPIDEAENKARYQAEQKARAMERDIRHTMRQIEGYKAVNNDEAKKRLKKAQKRLTDQNEAYMEFCKQNKITAENWRRRIV